MEKQSGYNLKPDKINLNMFLRLVVTYHDEGSEIMMPGLDDFKEILKRISSKCSVPAW